MKRRLADLDEKDWVELEDSYLDMFRNGQGAQVYMRPDGEWTGVVQVTGDIAGPGTALPPEDEELQ